ncbi:MAG TPA: glycosyltransferase family 39 protein [Chloroflexia bacterium]|nr:glycosyltransferase family 39 protein [Chloroflexia bacterium]
MTSPATTAATARTTPSIRALVRPEVVLWAVLALGLGLRLYRLDALDLWIDEGYVVMFSRQSWPDVLGFNGPYDPHPPLYFALVKLASVFLHETIAGRAVSMVMGTLTIPVVFVLARRMAGGWAGVAAALVLAVSPTHIWLSQEARMFVPAMLFVALSYLAAVAYYQGPSTRWAVAYGASVLLAMYFDYSALYPLVPQGLFLVWIAWKLRKRTVPLLAAFGAAVLLFLPWARFLLSAIEEADPFRVTYLGVTAVKVVYYILSLTGVAGSFELYAATVPAPWENAPALRWPLAIAIVVTVGIGLYTLVRRQWWPFWLALGLSVGAYLATIGLSYLSPGFAMRTVVFDILGWAVIAGAAAGATHIPRSAHLAGLAAFAILIAASLATQSAVYANAEKQHWSEIARDVDVVKHLELPVLLVRPLNYTLIDVYQPGTLDGRVISGTEQLATMNPLPGAFWWPYHDTFRFDPYREQIAALGYERVMHKYYFHPLRLDLFALPRTDIGTPVNLGGRFDERWFVPESSTVSPDGDTLTLTGSTGRTTQAEVRVPTPGAALVTAAIEYRAQGDHASAFLTCLDADGRAVEATEPTMLPPGDQWGRLRLAALCPGNAQSVVLSLRAPMEGGAMFRVPEVFRADLPPASRQQ